MSYHFLLAIIVAIILGIVIKTFGLLGQFLCYISDGNAVPRHPLHLSLVHLFLADDPFITHHLLAINPATPLLFGGSLPQTGLPGFLADLLHHAVVPAAVVLARE